MFLTQMNPEAPQRFATWSGYYGVGRKCLIYSTCPYSAFQSAASRRVTEMGTYVTQSAFSVGSKSSGGKSGSERKRPPLRQFFMDGDFTLSGSLSTALTKQALRFLTSCNDPRKQNVSCDQHTSFF